MLPKYLDGGVSRLDKTSSHIGKVTNSGVLIALELYQYLHMLPVHHKNDSTGIEKLKIECHFHFRSNLFLGGI